jgi:hypothetical protein
VCGKSHTNKNNNKQNVTNTTIDVSACAMSVSSIGGYAAVGGAAVASLYSGLCGQVALSVSVVTANVGPISDGGIIAAVGGYGLALAIGSTG